MISGRFYRMSCALWHTTLFAEYKMNVKEIDVEGVVLPNVPLSNIQFIDAAKGLNIDDFR